jgi:hypothetical protein
MRAQVVEQLRGVTPLLAIFYVPIPAYVLWINFYRYGGPLWVLLIPAALAFAAGLFDRKRNPMQVAAWLLAATYFVIVADTILELGKESPKDWLMAPVILVGAVIWTGIVIGLPTVFCTVLGGSVQMRFQRAHANRAATRHRRPPTGELQR